MPAPGRRAAMRCTRWLGLLAPALTIGLALLAPALAVAENPVVTDCAPPLPLEKAVGSADLVFVGTVTATTNNGRSATVTVTDVWRGDVPTPVTVNGGSDPTNAAEDDRTFDVGATYLFVPVLTGGALVDSVCSATVPWSDDLGRLRPPDARQPLPAAATAPGPLAFLGWLVGPAAVVGVIGGGAIALSLLVARRRDT